LRNESVPSSDDARRPQGKAKPSARRDTGTTAAGAPAPQPKSERWALLFLCVVGAGRIFYGAATLPFFADTDEQFHFDLVHKFARGHWPSNPKEFWDPEVVDVAVFGHSPEFQAGPSDYPVGRFPPPVRDWPGGLEKTRYVATLRAQLLHTPNHEAHSPPVYYALAGLWYDIGRIFGMSGAFGVYWVRFLNVPVFAGLVATAYALCRPSLGRDTAVAAAALTAFFPNNIFFTINSDVLSPLTAALTLVLVLRWYESDEPAPAMAAGTGAMAAAAVLVKLTNAAVLVVVAFAVLAKFVRDRHLTKTLRSVWPMVVCAAIPLALWGARNRLVLGDWTATSAKVEELTWTPKPLNELLDHPIFTADGLRTYLTRLTVQFFNGDANWHKHPARADAADYFFLATSALLPVVGFVGALWRGSREPQARFTAGLAAIAVVSFLGVLTYLSMRFDFGRCDFPSRQFPFFTSGRLISGGMVPLLVLYVLGIQTLLGRRTALVAPAVVATAAMMIWAQAPFLRLAAESQYNWFRLH
jgi:hypothetical protein